MGCKGVLPEPTQKSVFGACCMTDTNSLIQRIRLTAYLELLVCKTLIGVSGCGGV